MNLSDEAIDDRYLSKNDVATFNFLIEVVKVRLSNCYWPNGPKVWEVGLPSVTNVRDGGSAVVEEELPIAGFVAASYIKFPFIVSRSYLV